VLCDPGFDLGVGGVRPPPHPFFGYLPTAALAAVADAFVLKGDPPEEMLITLRQIHIRQYSDRLLDSEGEKMSETPVDQKKESKR